MNPKLFKLLMAGSVSWYNDVMGTELIYDRNKNQLKISGRLVTPDVKMMKMLISEGVATYNLLLPAPSDGNGC